MFIKGSQKSQAPQIKTIKEVRGRIGYKGGRKNRLRTCIGGVSYKKKT